MNLQFRQGRNGRAPSMNANQMGKDTKNTGNQGQNYNNQQL